jgi:hypothetical protein
MKSVLSAVRSMADKSRLNESAAAGRNDRAKLWGLDAAVPRHIGATMGCWDGRTDGEGGDSAWRAGRDGVLVGTQAGSRRAGGNRFNRAGGAGGSGAGDHEESSKAGVDQQGSRRSRVSREGTLRSGSFNASYRPSGSAWRPARARRPLAGAWSASTAMGRNRVLVRHRPHQEIAGVALVNAAMAAASGADREPRASRLHHHTAALLTGRCAPPPTINSQDTRRVEVGLSPAMLYSPRLSAKRSSHVP